MTGSNVWAVRNARAKERAEKVGAITDGIVESLSNDDYHAQTDWFGSTQLKAFLPEHYKTGGSDAALSFGSLFHTVCLEPDLMGEYVALDATKIGVKADGTPAQSPTMTKAWKDAVAEVEQDGRTVIDQGDLDKAEAMRDAVEAHPDASELIFGSGGRSELSVFATDENGIKHRARFDRYAPGTGVDLKSTSARPGAFSLTRAVIDWGYDTSAAHYTVVGELAGLDVGQFTLVFVSKEAPHRVTVCDLDEQFIKRGADLRALALERAAKKAEPYEGAIGRLTLFCPEWALPFEEMSL